MKGRDLRTLIASPLDLRRKKILCEDICKQRPRDADAWCYLGYVCGRLGLPEEAVRHLQKALSLRPDHVDAWNCLGNIWLDNDRPAEAATAFERAVSLQPSHAGALANLGRALGALGRKGHAMNCYKRALELDPDNLPALNNLGQAYHENMRYDKALACFRHAARLAPEDPYVYTRMGTLFRTTGQFDAALEAYGKALETSPGLIDAIAGLAATQLAQGRHEACLEFIDSLDENRKLHPQIAIIYSGLCHRFGRCEDALRLIRTILAGSKLDNWSQVQLHFAAARILEIQQHYGEAFDEYECANRLKRCNYDDAGTRRLYDSIKRVFTRELLGRLPRASRHDERPVFIVGMPRSGTTLVEQILDSHPGINGAGELPDIGQLYPRFIRQYMPAYKEVKSDLITTQALDEMAGLYLERLDEIASRATRITDKMPYNFFRLGLIELLFPGARVIHCVRNPMDTCLSCYFHDFQGSHDYAYDQTTFGSYYRQYADMMEHWRNNLSLPFLEIRYEDLVENTEEMSRKLIAFCGVEWDDRCLSFHENRRFVATSSKEQVNKPIYRSSIGRWTNYAARVEPLRQALGELADS